MITKQHANRMLYLIESLTLIHLNAIKTTIADNIKIKLAISIVQFSQPLRGIYWNYYCPLNHKIVSPTS